MQSMLGDICSIIWMVTCRACVSIYARHAEERWSCTVCRLTSKSRHPRLRLGAWNRPLPYVVWVPPSGPQIRQWATWSLALGAEEECCKLLSSYFSDASTKDTRNCFCDPDVWARELELEEKVHLRARAGWQSLRQLLFPYFLCVTL